MGRLVLLLGLVLAAAACGGKEAVTVTVTGSQPPPETVTVEETRQVYTIRAASTDVAITVELEHKSWGKLEGEVGIVGGPSARFSQISLF